MMAANYRHIGGQENRLGRHYSRFPAFSPAAPLARQYLAAQKFRRGGSNRRSQARQWRAHECSERGVDAHDAEARDVRHRVGNAVKWFPDRRGLAAGATAAGFGAGASLTIVPIANMILASGYQHAFLAFGIGQGVIVLALAFFLRKPSRVMPAKKKQLNLPQTKIDFTPPQ